MIKEETTMKTGKGIVTMGIIFFLVGGVFINVSASTSKPYGGYNTSIGTASAASTITKCSCSPVDNYLMAAIQIQYKSGNNYYWTPSSSSYYYSEGSDIGYAQKTISHSNITYAKGWFKARCGKGSVKSYYDTDSK